MGSAARRSVVQRGVGRWGEQADALRSAKRPGGMRLGRRAGGRADALRSAGCCQAHLSPSNKVRSSNLQSMNASDSCQRGANTQPV